MLVAAIAATTEEGGGGGGGGGRVFMAVRTYLGTRPKELAQDAFLDFIQLPDAGCNAIDELLVDHGVPSHCLSAQSCSVQSNLSIPLCS